MPSTNLTNIAKKLAVSIHHICGSCSTAPFLDFDTARPKCTNKRTNRHQAILCTCARTKQTMRVCTRHQSNLQSLVRLSLEPYADVRTTVLSPLDRDTRRRNETKHLTASARATTCSKRHVSARVIQHSTSTDVALLGQQLQKGEDVPISEHQDTHVEKACLLGPGFFPGQRHCQRPFSNVFRDEGVVAPRSSSSCKQKRINSARTSAGCNIYRADVWRESLPLSRKTHSSYQNINKLKMCLLVCIFTTPALFPHRNPLRTVAALPGWESTLKMRQQRKRPHVRNSWKAPLTPDNKVQHDQR